MKISFKHVLVCVFVSIVLVQVYFGIVQIVQGFGCWHAEDIHLEERAYRERG